jgi:mannose-1-phosphate guanylyltransferase/phosphomannomutase
VTLVKLLDLLCAVDRPLSRVLAAIPPVHVAHETIVTPWERKGTVMREIVERVGGRRVELVDGVKVFDDDHRWALVLPDPEDALTHVWAEAGSDLEARRLAQDYVQRIRQVLR